MNLSKDGKAAVSKKIRIQDFNLDNTTASIVSNLKTHYENLMRPNIKKRGNNASVGLFRKVRWILKHL